MPTQDQYESYDKQVRKQNLEGVLSNISLQADIQKFKDIGDASRIAMILQVIKHDQQKRSIKPWKQADASVRSLANWFSLGDLAGDKTRAEMSVPEGEAYDNLLRDLTNVRTKDLEFWM